MSKSTEVATVEAPSLPALPPMGGFERSTDDITLNDIVLPRIYLLQPLSEFVKSGDGKPGDVVYAGGTDGYPTNLISADDGTTEFTAYVVAREKFAATTSGGGISFHPDKRRDPNDDESWEGWFFDLAIPSHEQTLPIRWMLWKTAGAPAAKAINTLIQKRLGEGDTDPLAIRVRVKSKANRKGQPYFAPTIAPATPDDEGLEVARKVRDLVYKLNADRGYENSAPEPSAQPSFS